jgi:hypothetical protein
MREGHGHLQAADGGEYVGAWAADRRQGRGRQVWASGAKFEGEFYEDKMHGAGLRTKWTRRVPHPVLIGHAASNPRYENGNVYEGQVRLSASCTPQKLSGQRPVLFLVCKRVLL